MTRLEVQGPGNRRNNFEVRQEEVSIGRDAKNDLVLDDLRVSRQHAIIRQGPDGLTVRDLASGNGTLVNGQVLSAYFDLMLDDGDEVKVGNCTIIIHLDRPTTESAEFRQMLQRTPSDVLSASLPGTEFSQEVSPVLIRRQLEKLERLLRLFYELGEKLGSIFSLDEIYNQVFEILMQATPASRGFIFRKNEQGEFEEAASRTREEGEAGRPLPISKTIFEKVARERVSVLLTDAQTANQALSSQSIIAHQIRSVMASPIIGPRGLLGIIYADYYDLSETFSAQDLDILNAVAVQTGIAINTVINHERLQRQAEARARFERFLPRQVVDEILRSPEKIKLGGVRQKVTALFADIRNFTSLSENSSPELIVSLLNRYFTLVSEVIFKHGGTLDKYIGDGLLALFGAPYASELDAIQAVRAAIDMQRAMAAFNLQLTADHLPPISIGIGVNTGQAIVGYIGSESRLDYTAIGDTINTAARLEGIAKPGQIIITENTVQVLDESVQVRQLGTEKLKGKNVNLRFYEVIWQ
ncbi:MAG: adenylate/guanylate cyclase domain-containing protein [Acidobacteriota bacterium]